MRVKAKMSVMSCPDKRWLAVGKEQSVTNIPNELIQQCVDIMPKLKNGKADNQDTKRLMIELYNTIYNAHYKTTTSCPPCIKTCFTGVKKVADDYLKNK